ncbi:MAG: GGDEF domain-containing protein [Deltaproteobacteria bacterium]
MSMLPNLVRIAESLSRRYVAFLEGKGPLFNFLLGILCMGLLAVVDISNHNEYFLAFLYLLPIALTTWLAGRRYGLTLSVLATAVLTVEKLTANSLALAWNTLSTLCVFVTVTMLVAIFRMTWVTERQIFRTEQLSGALSPRSFSELVGYELQRLKRNIAPFSIGVINLDDFNVFNVMYGRQKGDELLASVAECLVNNLRKTDLVTRISEDEFIVYLPATDEVSVHVPLQKIRQKLAASVNRFDENSTFSVGVVTCRFPPENLEELLVYADKVLHEVKKSGKDGIRFALFAEA